MSAVVSGIDFRPDAPAFLRDPFPTLRRMREEDPVHWSPRLKSWVLTRYDDCKAVLLDKEVSSDRLRPFFASLPGEEAARIGQIIRYLTHWMVFRDPPEHTRLRRLTSKVFHLQSMNAMRPVAEELTQWLLERIGARREIDFVADFAGPLPALVIMAMLGVPKEDLARVKRMSDEMALFIGSSRMSGEKYDVAERATQEMAGFFLELIQDRKKNARADLLSQLVNLEDAGDRLTRGRARRHLHPAALCRPRDHHQPHRQRFAVAPAFPPGTGFVQGKSGTGAARHRGTAALRRAERRAGAHRESRAGNARQGAQAGRPGVPDAERRQPRSGSLRAARPAACSRAAARRT